MFKSRTQAVIGPFEQANGTVRKPITLSFRFARPRVDVAARPLRGRVRTNSILRRSSHKVDQLKCENNNRISYTHVSVYTRKLVSHNIILYHLCNVVISLFKYVRYNANQSGFRTMFSSEISHYFRQFSKQKYHFSLTRRMIYMCNPILAPCW